MLTLEQARGPRSQSSTLEDPLQQGSPLVKNPTQVDDVPLRTASPPKILEQVVRNHPVRSARRAFERRDASRIVQHGRRRQFVAFRRSIIGTAFNVFWEDELGIANDVQQGEGGEQGHPLMPMLFAQGQHSALVAVSERLQEGELLDDLHTKSSPNRSEE